MTDKEIQIWTSSIENVIRENEEWDDKNKSNHKHKHLNNHKPPKTSISRNP